MIHYKKRNGALAAIAMIMTTSLIASCAPRQQPIIGGKEAKPPLAKIKFDMSRGFEEQLFEQMKTIDQELGFVNTNPAANLSFLSTTDIEAISSLPRRKQFEGMLKAYKTARIVGGFPAVNDQFPWQVFLTASSQAGTFECGGAILDEWHVLTAAHCMYDDQDDRFSAGNMTVMYGSTKLWLMNSVKVKRATHPTTYLQKSGTKDNDIAVLRLEAPLTYTSSVGPVVLPVDNAPELSDRIDLTVSGFGMTENGNSSATLLYGDVKYIIKENCKNNSAYQPEEIFPSMVCAGLEDGGVDSCQGDSGGPLTLKGSNNLIGIVSWGVGCGQRNYPGIYSDVSKFIPFINDVVSSRLNLQNEQQ